MHQKSKVAQVMFCLFLFGMVNIPLSAWSFFGNSEGEKAGKQKEVSVAIENCDEQAGLSAAIENDVSAIIENLDALEGESLRDRCCCCPPKKLCVCEVCAKKIYALCLNACIGKIKNLHTRRAKVEKIWSYVTTTCKLCAYKAKIGKLWTYKTQAQELCSYKAKIDELWADKICSEGICVNGNVEHCTAYKADITLSNTLFGYNLGDKIPFDTIIADPNGNVNLAPPITEYVAPKTGYYIATLSLDVCNLQGVDVISGTPIAHPEICIDDHSFIHVDQAMLAFTGHVNSLVTGIIHLNAGSKVSSKFNVRYNKNGNGLTPYVGTVALGSGGGSCQSFFRIHYLSSDCPLECEPCPIDCEPCPIVCCPPHVPFHCHHCHHGHHCHHSHHGHHGHHGCYEDDYCCHDGCYHGRDTNDTAPVQGKEEFDGYDYSDGDWVWDPDFNFDEPIFPV